MRHVLSILLQNHPGALARVSTMFASRGFNIESLNVAPTEDERVSRLTLVTTGSDDVIGQINKQLAKLVEVVAIADRTEVEHLERELCLLKLRVESASVDPLRLEVENFGARILEDASDHLILELTGTEAQIDGFMADLPRGVEVLSVVRSGSMAVSSGSRARGDDLDQLFEDEALMEG
jgi:acetolactate synthase-1/3 small subunit